MPRWHISNRKIPRGQLADIRRIIRGPERLSARSVIVPIESDPRRVADIAGGLAGEQVRSFEMWWDAAESRLRFVIISDERDADDFERAFQVMYPNAAFGDMRETVPAWFERGSACRVFDVGTRHGHYATVFDETGGGGGHSLITRMASAVQSASHAWIQFVFARLDCTSFLRTHMSRLDARFMEINRGDYTSLGDEITGKKPRKHPELGYDLTSNYKGLKKHVMAKMQGAHVIMSMRGLVQGGDGKDVDLPLDRVSALSVDGIDSTYEHLAKFRYEYGRFYSDAKKSQIRVPGSRGARDHRVCIFESRHLPDPDQFFGRAISQYFDRGWWGLCGYQTRRPMPFLILNPSEVPLFVHLPDPSTPNVETTRGVRLPSKPSEKEGASIGFFDSLDDPGQSGPTPEDAGAGIAAG